MPKKKQVKKQEKEVKTKDNSLIRILVIAIILLIFVVVYLFLQVDKLRRMEIEEKVCNEEDIDWILDNCECVERNIRTCREGFELDGKMCRRDNEVTNSLLECSKYECNSTINIEE